MKIISVLPFLYLFLSVLLSGCALFQSQSEFTLLHYNIKELDSRKLADPKNEQLQAVSRHLNDQLQGIDFDILSVNEIQYDKPQVPSKKFQSFGMNLNKLVVFLTGKKDWNSSFTEANTGKRAKKWRNRYMTPERSGARKYADPVNYGLFPGQYSTGLATPYEVIGKVVVNDLHWKEFLPKRSLSKYKDANGKPLPQKMELFDKSFSDTILRVHGKTLHLITLHTVPAYHFGNSQSPNYQRNADQLRFLEWYLTGKTDVEINLPERFAHIKPLSAHSTYVAVGDWNTDLLNKANPGSKVLRRLDQTGRLFPGSGDLNKDREEMITNEGAGYHPKRLKMTLDYLFYSKDLMPLRLNVLRPKSEKLFLGCGSKKLPSKKAQTKDTKERVFVTYQNHGEKCQMTVSKKLHIAKKASDHFPLLAQFKIR